MNTRKGLGETRRPELIPYFFQNKRGQIFACHHLPEVMTPGRVAALLCNPVGHEYERCHRAMRQLAAEFSKTGGHSMRFDYSGTGDSSGEYAAASLAHWRSDTEDAIEECRRLSGRTSVCIVGFRLGATLAAQAAAGRDDVDSLVLYAPVIDGASLIAEWEDEQKKFDLKHSHAAPVSQADELLGFPLTKSLRSDLEKPLFVEALSVSLRRVLILAHDHDAVAGLADGLGSSGASVSVEIIDTPEIWRREPLEAFVPLKLLRRIVEWINEVST